MVDLRKCCRNSCWKDREVEDELLVLERLGKEVRHDCQRSGQRVVGDQSVAMNSNPSGREESED